MFDTRVAGIPCKCQVVAPSWDGKEITTDTFNYRILDRRGRPAPWLEKKLTPQDSERLLDEFLLDLAAEYWNPYD